MTSALYFVNAVPQLIHFGEFEGFIDHVDLTATAIQPSSGLLCKAPHQNDGTLPDMFCDLVSPELSAEILSELRVGHTVQLPGLFTSEQLEEIGFYPQATSSVPAPSQERIQPSITMFRAPQSITWPIVASSSDGLEAAINIADLDHLPYWAA